jgi:hypothetical protein
MNAPLAIVVSFGLLGVMLYKHVHLGISLNATALLLGILALDWWQVPTKIYDTSIDLLTISIVLATFGIMWLSQLYKETKLIDSLSESLSRLIKNPRIIMSLLPAVIGFLPVSGGALMSAPLVDSEAEKLNMKPEKKAYVNLWFRHTIFPVYPISPVLIITAALTGITIPSIILHQIPVVAVMIVTGFLIGLWRVSSDKKSQEPESDSRVEARRLLISFSPLLTTILVVIVLDIIFPSLANLGYDVLIAVTGGLIALIAISRPNFHVLTTPLKKWGIYDVTLAAYGAFLLRNIIGTTTIPGILQTLVKNGAIDILLFLTLVPAILGALTGSPSGGVTISGTILKGIMDFSAKTASLMYMSAYLGYTIAPTHLCFTFTANYFKCSLGKIYKYVIPSFIASFAMALLMYFLF